MILQREHVNHILIAIIIVFCFIAVSSDQANAQDICSLVIEKVSPPSARNTSFNFEIITDEGTETVEFFESSQIEFEAPETITITELVEKGWTLESIECDQGKDNCGEGGEFIPCLNITINEQANSITAECFDTDEGSCTFTNVPSPPHIPTLSKWGYILLATALGLIGYIVIKRKQLTV